MAKIVVSDAMLEAAIAALHKGPPGVLRRVAQIDSYPGEFPGDPEGYKDIGCSRADEKAALRDAIEAAIVYLESGTTGARISIDAEDGKPMRVTIISDDPQVIARYREAAAASGLDEVPK